MSTSRQRRRLADRFTAGLADLPVPATPDVLFAALTRVAGEVRGREVVLLREIFPPQTASGLWLQLESQDILVVDERAAPWHQLVIFFHEVWHMLEDDCGMHTGDAHVAARVLNRRDDPGAAAVSIAARTGFSTRAEQDAERFGLLMGQRLREWLHTGPAAPAPREPAPDSVATRIEAALGYCRTPRG
ncbi:hypothetical protein OK074_5389 [Actinobacteria bacterium OK074]|nr:hypothetical protein OK074_5389 [Actinobacteria bacterium OK074]